MPGTAFQIAFQAALKRSGHSLEDAAKTTGIALVDLQALQSDTIARFDVSDAKTLAVFLGSTLWDLLQAPELKGPVEIAALYNQLPEHLKAQFLISRSERTEGQDLPAQE